MPARRPLVRIGGKTKQLPVGDTVVDDSIGFAYAYPNGGSEASPANALINSRYPVANPFPGHQVACQAQILVSGEWTDIGIGGWASGQSGGCVATQRDLNTLLFETGVNFIGTVTPYHGWGAVTRSNLTAATPCRIKVWRIRA